MGRTAKLDWAQEASRIDWDRTTADLAREYDVCNVWMATIRKKYGRRRRENGGRDWAQEAKLIDWDRGNTEIARDYGVTGSWISKVRGLYGRPRSEKQSGGRAAWHTLGRRPKRDWGQALKGVDWSRSNDEIGRDFDVSECTIAKYRRIFGESRKGHPPHQKKGVLPGPWSMIYRGKTWRDMPGSNEFNKKTNFFFFRRGMLRMNEHGELIDFLDLS